MATKVTHHYCGGSGHNCRFEEDSNYLDKTVEVIKIGYAGTTLVIHDTKEVFHYLGMKGTALLAASAGLLYFKGPYFALTTLGICVGFPAICRQIKKHPDFFDKIIAPEARRRIRDNLVVSGVRFASFCRATGPIVGNKIFTVISYGSYLNPLPLVWKVHEFAKKSNPFSSGFFSGCSRSFSFAKLNPLPLISKIFSAVGGCLHRKPRDSGYTPK